MANLKLFTDNYSKGVYNAYGKNLRQVQKELAQINPKQIEGLYNHLNNVKKKIMPKTGTIQTIEHSLLSNDFMLKIVNHCLKFGFDIKSFIRSAKKDTFLASYLIKDPKKQNIYENRAHEILLNTFKRAKPVNVKNLYLSTDGKLNNIKTPLAQLVDFTWEYKGYKIVAIHKYLKEHGGAQRSYVNQLSNFNIKAPR